jgi:hypothetical protein
VAAEDNGMVAKYSLPSAEIFQDGVWNQQTIIQTQWTETSVTSAPKVAGPGIGDLLLAGLDYGPCVFNLCLLLTYTAISFR